MVLHRVTLGFVAAIVMVTAGTGNAARGAEAAACADPTVNLPAALAGWAKPPAAMATAYNVREAATHPLPLGERIAFKLANTESIKFAHQPSEQMPKQYVHSGMAFGAKKASLSGDLPWRSKSPLRDRYRNFHPDVNK
jgi:hypothetical protein